MKKLTIALLFPILSFSQIRFNDVEYFTISMINDPRASVKAGVSFIGCEINKEYFDESQKRYENFVAQTRLF